jgi:hypothetical protein
MLGALIATAIAIFGIPTFAGRIENIDLKTLETPIYSVDGDAFVRHNGDRYCNRPLYCNQISAVAFGGDKPYTMVGNGKTILGDLMFALIRAGKGKWLQSASDITSKYRPGRMEWIVKDALWGPTTIHIEVVPAAQGPGVAAHMRVDESLPGDTLVWASGASFQTKASVLNDWDMTTPGGPYSITRGFVPADCDRNVVHINGKSWTLQPKDGVDVPASTGGCSATSTILVADASAWKDPAVLLKSRGKSQPIASGAVTLMADGDIYWYLHGVTEADAVGDASPQGAFNAGMQRVRAIEDKVVVDTPDPWLNAAVGASSSVTAGVFRKNIYTHAGMRWGVPLLGWRTIFGGTVYGWHDRVMADAGLCIDKQITESDKTTPIADVSAGLASQSADSRMFGKGRIDIYQPHHYDMQSQFFDQIEHAWRWTGAPDLEKLLRPAIELHCQYIKDCFDPQGLGIYESYANTWPTDDQWYNGGGTSEETAYAYRAELTALQLSQRAGDIQAVQLHAAAVARIRKGFFDLLWIPQLGYPGAYREQLGLKRLHESCWLYSIFCPIDAGLLDTEQAAQALQYTEWGLQRLKLPYGGEQCWPSNWVPSIWSVREMWPGDNYQLALAYFQTGLPDDGWTLLHGTFPQQLLFGPVPGDLGYPAGGTDFNDCASMFARTIVEGLFGYVPDYPDGIVKIAPQFPSEWDHASIKTPDMSIAYRRYGAVTKCDVTLAHACAMDVQLPVATTGVQAVIVDGKSANWELMPGFGRSVVKISLPSANSAIVEVTCRDSLKTNPAIRISANVGETLSLHVENARIVDFHDPQGAITNAKLVDGAISGNFSDNAGDHLVLALIQVGDARQWQLFKIHITDARASQALAAKTELSVPKDARWAEVPIEPALNGDIRAIYKQKYLSPRPNTCSLRLATDGYSTWQMVLNKRNGAPEIDLADLPSLSDSHGNLLVQNGVPFLFSNGGKDNIAFTSRWDNWPREIDVPVNRTGDAVWFLLCGTTNPMEVRIPNAELRLNYTDGVVEKLEIVPPFNFWTLCPLGGIDYDYTRDGFSLPKSPPMTVQLGNNCRATVLGWHLRTGVTLKSITLETLSEQVVIGLMGVTIMD